MPGAGYSSAPLRRFEIQYAPGDGSPESISRVVKAASLLKRRTLYHLYCQGHRCIPYCHTLDLEQDASVPLCMQYIDPSPADVSSEELARTARSVAAIQAANLQDSSLKAWLPPADGAFVESGYVLGTFRKSWAQALADPDFMKAYGAASVDLEATARQFRQDVEDLWQEGNTLTLIHGDLHDGNLVLSAGQPYIVDWEHARYGSLYLDLPNLFPGDEALLYYKALAECGVKLDEQEYFDRYRKMGRYVGFKYMGFVLSHWASRDAPGSWVRDGLENLIDMALNGAKILDL